MDQGISVSEACEKRVMSPEDFERTCNEDGSVKPVEEQTTVSYATDTNTSVTIDNGTLQLWLIGAFLVAGVVAFLVTRMLMKHFKR